MIQRTVVFFFQAEDGIRDCLLSRGLGDVYKRQFQVWGSTMGQVTTLVNHVLNSLAGIKKLNNHKAENILPAVFIKNGYYNQGKLHLNIINLSLIHI